ncbi:MAG TPA: hypothetical protein VJQ45_09345 [Ktedonobacterales bacterium]|nr:hypothetical protein [Ktedonobacterales bacterium]
MRIVRDFMRIIALVIGLIAALIGILIDIGYVIASHVQSVSSHGFLGFVAVLIGIIGALAAPFNGVVGAILMVISAVAFFVIALPVAGGWAAVSGVLFLIAAALAYFDRSRARARAQAA